MRKKFMLLIIIILFSFTIPVFGDDGGIVEEQLNNLEIEDIQQFIDRINLETDGYIPQINVKNMIMGLFKGNPITNIKQIVSGLGRYFIKEVIMNFSLLGKIIILAILCAVLQNLHSAFEKDSVGKLSYNICYMLIIILTINSFYVTMKLGTEAIDTMVSFIYALLPTLFTLLISVGAITSSTVFQPIIFTSISVMTTFIKTILVPLIYFSAVLAILNNLSDTIKISRLASLMKQFSLGLLGLLLTIFIGLISIQGIASSSLDGVTVKTAKFAIDSFIPIVGGFLTDAMDTVVTCSMLIKNAIGVIGLIVLLLICSLPLIKMFTIIVIYKISSALIQPILDNQIVQCLNDMGNTLMIMLACVIAVAVMFFIAITVIMGVGNMTVMLR